ncbi:MAG: HAMP domain-containing protein, partial [Gammaproteobacteria bacterium]|nr:HAMP domain-containing protein [Gammaproteobacteria bacterium]
MSFSIFKNLGLLALLAILLVVVGIGVRLSDDTLHGIERVSLITDRATHGLTEINQLLSTAELGFESLRLYRRQSPEDIQALLTRLVGHGRELDIRTATSDGIGSLARACYVLFGEYLDEERAAPGGESSQALLARLRANLGRILDRLKDSSRELPGLGPLRATISEITVAAELEIDMYANRSRLDPDLAIVPVDRAIVLLDGFPASPDNTLSMTSIQSMRNALTRFRGALYVLVDELDAGHDDDGLDATLRAASIELGRSRTALQLLDTLLSEDLNREQDAVTSRLKSKRVLIVRLGIVGLILAVLVSYMLGRRLSKRLETLHAGARAFTAGQLGHRLPVRHRDPIGRLQEAFNQMAETLQSKETDIQRHIDRLNESVNDAQAANRAKTEFLANMS